MIRNPADRASSRGTEPRSQSRAVRDGLRVRNYDHLEGHSVRVSVTSARTDRTRSERCYLSPGQSRSMLGAIETGCYQLRIEVDGITRTDQASRLDDTAVIELGNGIVSVTSGRRDLPGA